MFGIRFKSNHDLRKVLNLAYISWFMSRFDENKLIPWWCWRMGSRNKCLFEQEPKKKCEHFETVALTGEKKKSLASHTCR